MNPTPSVTAIYAIRLGNTYVVSNPAVLVGDRIQHVVMDSAFADIASYLR